MSKIVTPKPPQISIEEFQEIRETFAQRGPGDRVEQFKILSDHLIPGWIEWHSWARKIIDAGCKHRWIGLSGCSNCVAGHTRILNPVTGEQPTIQELCEQNIAPIVMTLNGPVQAEIPFIKGSADLFEIRLENGSCFVATADHVVLSANGFVPVESLALGQDLFSYVQSPRESISELYQSVHVGDGQSSLRTVPAFPVDCPISENPVHGEQLLSAVETDQSFSPLPSDAQECTRSFYSKDDLDSKRTHSLSWLQSFLPSNARFAHRHNFSDNHVSHLADPAIVELDGHLFQPLGQFRVKNDGHAPFSKPTPDSFHTQNPNHAKYLPLPISRTSPEILTAHQPLPQFFGLACTAAPTQESDPETGYTDSEALSIDSIQYLSALDFKVSQSRIESIRKLGKDLFYDISVPGPEHYFAEGTIHHNSSKTRHAAGFAAVWWLADPENSSVCFCSTTMKMLRRRGWAEIQDISNKIEGWGNFVNSQCVWQVTQGDDKHCIFGKAVCEGDTNKVAADIQGLHVKRLMIVIDEAEAVPAAIWKACANLYGYCEDNGGEFVLFAIANARSRLSQFGRFIEPENGWGSVSVDSDDWMSKPQMDGRKAKVLRFDFLKSPNIVEGKLISRHLPTRQRVENRMAALAARGGENDPDHYTYDRGFPVPEGLLKTVFTETLIAKHDGYGRHKFLGTNFSIIGMFDQAFGGGDRPALRFAALGDIEGGKLGIEWCEAIILYLDATSAEPVRYQLMNKLRRACESVDYRGQKYQCPPENLAIDCTGDGGLADICHQEWSPKINRIIFSEKSSDSPVSNEDERPGSEVFLNKRVEMYFRTRDALIAGQIKGIDKDTAAELCNLEELVEKSDGTVRPRKTLQSKKDYKLKYQTSPDLSDCAVGLTEMARLKGFSVAAVGLTISREGALEQIVKDSQSLYDPDSFYQSDNEDYVEDELELI